MFSHICSFGTSGQRQHQRPTRKAGSQLRGWTRCRHSASTSWYSRMATECLQEPQYPALWWYSLFWSCSRDSSINPCCAQEKCTQPPEPSSPAPTAHPCTFPVLPGLVGIKKTSAETVPASPGSKSSTGKGQGSHSPSLLPVAVFAVMQGTPTALQARGICSPSKTEAYNLEILNFVTI